ncbi:transcriptional repressor [Tenacibaculum sp. ZH5_bin.1]|uniref:Fur family transcriptional regulator n=1 Tax=Tenacibaculum TaxID=104267 RepID=UPI0014320EBC|nr:transcriptional repressor [Tenacibaculum mesophilum]KAF9659278.1 transcriptional repressor [Tenacibaculum mesophilum]
MGVIRKTKAVKKLLSLFESGVSAIAAVDLVSKLNDEMNKTTVYRVLDRLENDGVIHSFMGKGGVKWYAKCTSCSSHHHNDIHPHFQCTDCKKVTCLSVDISIPQVENHIIESATVFLTGKCEICS